MTKFVPDFIFKKIQDISIDFLNNNKIKALLIDVDETLTIHNSMDINEEVFLWLDLVKSKNIKILLFSNNGDDRVRPFAKKLNLEYIASAKKPMLQNYYLAKNILHESKENIACIGDQIFTDIYGANKYNITSIYVFPISKKPNSQFLTFKRMIEKIYIKKYYRLKGKNNE